MNSVARLLTSGRKLQRRSEETRRAILAAARAEFAGKGFEGGSMRSVARGLGLEIAHIQHHFGDKASLWTAVVNDVIGEFLARQTEALAKAVPGDAGDTLEKFLDVLVRHASETPDFVSMMAHTRISPHDEYAAAYAELLVSHIRRGVRLIAEAQKQGEFVAGDPTLLFYHMVGAATRVYAASADVHAVLGRSPSAPELVESNIATCIALFMPERARRRAPAALQSIA